MAARAHARLEPTRRKTPWWGHFQLADFGVEDLIDENEGLAGLEFEVCIGGIDRCPVHRYRFPAQDTDISKEDSLHKVGGEALGTITAIDAQARVIDVKQCSNTTKFHPSALFAHSVVTAREQAEALFRLGE